MDEFPNPCTRCGMCCLVETCPIGCHHFSIEKDAPCPALSFEDDVASCSLPVVPTGDGCCIDGKAYCNGVEFDFAALPAEMKVKAVRQLKGGSDGRA